MTTTYHSKELTKMRLIMNDRALSLVDEGYIIVTITSTKTTWFTKLKHRTNGNVITITADIANKKFTQIRNGVVVIDSQNIL